MDPQLERLLMEARGVWGDKVPDWSDPSVSAVVVPKGMPWAFGEIRCLGELREYAVFLRRSTVLKTVAVCFVIATSITIWQWEHRDISQLRQSPDASIVLDFQDVHPSGILGVLAEPAFVAEFQGTKSPFISGSQMYAIKDAAMSSGCIQIWPSGNGI
jgi:hypothetical protein